MQTADNGTFRRVNAVFANWVGYDVEALVGKRRLQDLLVMGSKIFHQTHWAPLLSMQGSLSEVKLELLHRDGHTIPMVLNALRHEENGEIVHEIAAYVARDRDRYEQELLLSRKRLEVMVAEANQLHAEARDRALFAEQMIGIVSHDLRNPLATIKMASELLARGKPEAHDRLLVTIERSVTQANGLLADLLDFTQARVGAGLSVTIAPVDLHAAVAEIVEGLRVTYPTVVLTHTRSGEGECVVDAVRIGQAIGNLVSNAVVHGRAGTPIDVTSGVDTTSASVSVHNQGDPIPPQLLATLFEPMTRGTSDRSNLRSVGLGLFIVQQIAKAHRGTASVESTAVAGTTFTVTVPRIASPAG